MDLPDVRAIYFAPIIRLHHIQRTRVAFARGTADPVSVIFDDKQHWQFLLLRETNCLEKIALPRRRITNGGDNRGVFAIELDAPSHSAGREKLGARRGRHTPNVFLGAAVMRRHLPTVTFALRLCKIIDRQLPRTHTATEDQSTIAVVRDDVIISLHLNRNRGQPFVPHTGNMKMAFALAIKILLAQIAMPALEQDGQKSQLFLPVQFRHRPILNEKTSTCFLQRISATYAVGGCKTNRKKPAL